MLGVFFGMTFLTDVNAASDTLQYPKLDLSTAVAMLKSGRFMSMRN